MCHVCTHVGVSPTPPLPHRPEIAYFFFLFFFYIVYKSTRGGRQAWSQSVGRGMGWGEGGGGFTTHIHAYTHNTWTYVWASDPPPQGARGKKRPPIRRPGAELPHFTGVPGAGVRGLPGKWALPDFAT